MTRANETKHFPIRTCTGCGKKDTAESLIRVVATSKSILMVDLKRNLPGRGAWLHPDLGCYLKAKKSGRLTRSIRLKNQDEKSWEQPDQIFAELDGAGQTRS